MYVLNFEDGKIFMNEINKLKHDLKRGINIIGTGLKFLFGTMDNDDEEYITNVLQDIGDRQDVLHDSVVDSVHLMTNMTMGLIKREPEDTVRQFQCIKEKDGRAR